METKNQTTQAEGVGNDVLLAFIDYGHDTDTTTPRTDKAAYYMGREGAGRDGERWCDLLNESRAIERDLTASQELLLEAADSVHASLAETDISDSRREYREGLERRLRSLANGKDHRS